MTMSRLDNVKLSLVVVMWYVTPCQVARVGAMDATQSSHSALGWRGGFALGWRDGSALGGRNGSALGGSAPCQRVAP